MTLSRKYCAVGCREEVGVVLTNNGEQMFEFSSMCSGLHTYDDIALCE